MGIYIQKIDQFVCCYVINYCLPLIYLYLMICDCIYIIYLLVLCYLICA